MRTILWAHRSQSHWRVCTVPVTRGTGYGPRHWWTGLYSARLTETPGSASQSLQSLSGNPDVPGTSVCGALTGPDAHSRFRSQTYLWLVDRFRH